MAETSSIAITAGRVANALSRTNQFVNAHERKWENRTIFSAVAEWQRAQIAPIIATAKINIDISVADAFAHSGQFEEFAECIHERE